jgi:hypothetical protein
VGPAPNRTAFLIQVFFAGSLSREEILTQLRKHLALHQDRLAEYRGPVGDIVRQNIEKTGLEREGIFWALTLDAGIEYEKGWIRWCRKAIKTIEGMNDETNR